MKKTKKEFSVSNMVETMMNVNVNVMCNVNWVLLFRQIDNL